MEVRRKVMKARSSHGDGRDRSIGLKSHGIAFRQVYKRLMNRPVLVPAVPPDTNGRVLTAAVKAVVDPKK
jgi:hypothetical protein